MRVPWQCPTCETDELGDDAPCPGCGASKTSWTVQSDKTRRFAVSTKRLLVRRGVGTVPLPSDAAGQAGVERCDAAEVRAMSKEAARALARAGGMPPAADVLFVELYARRAQRVPVRAAVGGAVRTFEVDAPPGLQARADLPLLCVTGPGDLEGISFPGLHVLDVTGASSLALDAFGLPPRAVRVVVGRFVTVRVLDEQGRKLPGARMVLLGPGGTGDARAADAEGVVTWDGLGEGPYHVAFEDPAYAPDAEPTRAEPLEPPLPPSEEPERPITLADLEEGHTPGLLRPRGEAMA